MKNLLVPVDFSDYAYNACLFALNLASREGGKVTLVHVYHIPIIDPLMPADYLSNLAETAEKDVSARMEKLKAQLREYQTKQGFGKVEMASVITMGFAVDEIILTAQKHTPDLIVMGRRYTEGMKKILSGSITSDIIEKAPVPVLVVPENVAPHSALTDILYASEFSDDDQRALKYLIRFGAHYHSAIHCVHVARKEEAESRQKMDALEKQFADDEKNKRIEFHTISSENVTDGLLDYAGSKNISMMAMLTHRRSFFISLFDRSLTLKIAFKTNIPLMVFHAGK